MDKKINAFELRNFSILLMVQTNKAEEENQSLHDAEFQSKNEVD